MRLIPREFSWHQKRLASVVTPFLTINIFASLIFLLWPFAIPVLCAEFCLLAIWSAWGPGAFWNRFLACMGVGVLLFLSQIYLWVVLFTVSAEIRIILVMVLWLFSTWILAQIPLWGMRYIWHFRITDHAERDLEPFSIQHMMTGTTMICIAFASGRWATSFLAQKFGPFRFDKAIEVFGLVFLEVYLIIGMAALGTIVTFRLNRYTARFLPLALAGGLFAGLSAWIWFTFPEYWFFGSLIWIGSIMFSWAIILPMDYIRKLGYGLYVGTHQLPASVSPDSKGL